MTPIEQLDHAARAALPEFSVVKTLAGCADQLNQTHPDYPLRVPLTGWLLGQLARGQYRDFTEGDCRQVHKVLLAGSTRSTGAGRRTPAQTCGASYPAPSPGQLPNLLEACFPLRPVSERDLGLFYARFQCIQPFEAGNALVGGILVAALSKELFGYYLTVTPEAQAGRARSLNVPK